LKKLFIDIREFFWPLLESEKKKKALSNTEPNIFIHIADENLDKAFELKLKIFENEDERRKGVESKAALFISTISVVSSIVVAANSLIIGNKDYNLAVKVSVTVSFILSLYAARAVWFSVKALERGTYHVVDFSDINLRGKKNEYLKLLMKRLSQKMQKNYAVINKKVDYLTLAQAYYKRAIVTLSIYAFLVLLFCLFRNTAS
jgi:hypothetical protein